MQSRGHADPYLSPTIVIILALTHRLCFDLTVDAHLRSAINYTSRDFAADSASHLPFKAWIDRHIDATESPINTIRDQSAWLISISVSYPRDVVNTDVNWWTGRLGLIAPAAAGAVRSPVS